MGLDIAVREHGGSVETHSSELYRADRKLWLDAEGNIVEDGDPAAAFLYLTEGDEIPLAEAQEKGLVDGPDTPAEEPEAPAEPSEPEPAEETPEPSDADGEKQAEKPADKRHRFSKNKKG